MNRHAEHRRKVIHMIDTHDTLHIATRSPKGMAQAARLVLVASLLLFPLGTPAYAGGDLTKAHITSYAGSLLTPLELSAALVLWTHESNLNPRARNGSHFGICQGKSEYMKRANYKQQVQWCIAYSWHRYGTMVKALDHWKKKGWH